MYSISIKHPTIYSLVEPTPPSNTYLCRKCDIGKQATARFDDSTAGAVPLGLTLNHTTTGGPLITRPLSLHSGGWNSTASLLLHSSLFSRRISSRDPTRERLLTFTLPPLFYTRH